MFSCGVGVLAQEITKCQRATFLASTGLNHVNVMGVRPTTRAVKERTYGIVGMRHMNIAQRGERLCISADRLELIDGHLDVDDRLRLQTRNRRRAVMVDATSELPERAGNAIPLRLEFQNPARIVGDICSRSTMTVSRARPQRTPSIDRCRVPTDRRSARGTGAPFRGDRVQLPNPFAPAAAVLREPRVSERMEVLRDRLTRHAGSLAEARNREGSVDRESHDKPGRVASPSAAKTGASPDQRRCGATVARHGARCSSPVRSSLHRSSGTPRRGARWGCD